MFTYKGPSEIFHRDIPDELTVQQFINKKTNFIEVMQKVQSAQPNKKSLYQVALPVSIESLREAYQVLVKQTGLFPWKTKNFDVNAYKSLSVTHNPDHQDKIHPFASSLGTQKSEEVYAFTYENNDYQKIKDSYYDAYSFRRIHPTIQKEFNFFFSKFNLSLLRSRFSVIDHSEAMITSPNFGWHIDEPIFHNLRVNIPLITEPNYLLEIKSDDYYFNEHLPVGCGYSWNTLLPHRAYAQGKPTLNRAHLILGFSPWFDYNADRDSWTPSQFWGLHPFELIENNLIFKP